ncbi:4-amino-4-deoxy-L-arabinose-phosphoundecaprenol flippase subunit ArnE [compost metagenome]
MSDNRSPLPRWVLLALLVTGIIAISFSSIFIRWSHAPSSVMAMYRLFITALLMAPFVWRSKPDLKALRRADWGLMAVSGLFLALHFLFWMESLAFTSVASSTIILALEPILILAGAYWLFKERTTRKAVLGLAVAILGAALIGWGDIGISGKALTGDLLSLAGTAAVALHLLAGQRLASRVPSLFYSFFIFCVSGTAFLVYNLARGIALGGYPAREWGIFLLLAIVPTVFGHVLFNWLLQYVNAVTVSMSVLGEPVGATILAYLLLNEKLTLIQAAAGLVIIWGVWYFMRHNKVHYAGEEAKNPGKRKKPVAGSSVTG